MSKRTYHREYADCPFCGAPYRVYKAKASRCENPACGVGIPRPSPGSKSGDALDHAPVSLSTTTGQAILKVLEGEGEEPETDAFPIPGFGTIQPDEVEQTWADRAAEARTQAWRQPWTLHEAGGRCWLIQWRDRTADLRQNAPGMPAPQTPVVIGEVGTLDGKAFVVPIRCRVELQQVLDEHSPGMRLEDVPVFRNRPGRRHPLRESEWERDKAERRRLRYLLERLRETRPEQDLRDHPAARRLSALREKWRNANQCKAWRGGLNYCLNFIPHGSRQEYCSEACKTAGKRRRRIP